jgi:hypothetical protein
VARLFKKNLGMGYCRRRLEKFLEKFWEWESGPPLFLVLPVLPPPGGFGLHGEGIPGRAHRERARRQGQVTDSLVIKLLTDWSLIMEAV